MNISPSDIRGLGDTARLLAEPMPATGVRRSATVGMGAASGASAAETFSMDAVSRFFNRIIEPEGNALIGEMVDENGPLAGRESARGKYKPGALAMQFNDDSRAVLFAPNDAPDELPGEPTQLHRLLQQQVFWERRSFPA